MEGLVAVGPHASGRLDGLVDELAAGLGAAQAGEHRAGRRQGMDRSG